MIRTLTTTRTRTRFIRVGFAVALAVLLLPGIASALETQKATVKPNVNTTSGTVGGVPTRLTVELNTQAGENISEMTIVLPKGTDLASAKVDVVVLEGLKRLPIESKATASGSSLGLVFSPSVGPDSLLRVEVTGLVYPQAGGTFNLEGTYLSGGVESALPKSATPYVIEEPNTTQKIITWLDHQAWVARWNSVQALSMFLKPQLVAAAIPQLFLGWLRSIMLVAIGFPIAIPIGLLLAFAKMSKIHPLRWIASIYVNVIRGTPLFLQMYIAFFGLPLVGVRANEYILGIIVLALNSSAYLTEIFRAGIQSINKGQFEAAASLGMTYAQSMQNVIIPQTVKRILPTMTSEFILLYKDTALLAAVGVFELMMYSKNLTANTANITPYVVAAIYYLIVTTPLISWVQSLERKLAVSEGGHTPDDKSKKRREPSSNSAASNLSLTASKHESR